MLKGFDADIFARNGGINDSCVLLEFVCLAPAVTFDSRNEIDHVEWKTESRKRRCGIMRFGRRASGR